MLVSGFDFFATLFVWVEGWGHQYRGWSGMGPVWWIVAGRRLGIIVLERDEVVEGWMDHIVVELFEDGGVVVRVCCK